MAAFKVIEKAIQVLDSTLETEQLEIVYEAINSGDIRMIK